MDALLLSKFYTTPVWHGFMGYTPITRGVFTAVDYSTTSFKDASVYNVGMDPAQISQIIQAQPSAILGPQIHLGMWLTTDAASREMFDLFQYEYTAYPTNIRPAQDADVSEPEHIHAIQWRPKSSGTLPLDTVLYVRRSPDTDPGQAWLGRVSSQPNPRSGYQGNPTVRAPNALQPATKVPDPSVPTTTPAANGYFVNNTTSTEIQHGSSDRSSSVASAVPSATISV